MRKQIRQARDLQEPPCDALPVKVADPEAGHRPKPPLRAVRLQRQGQERDVRPLRVEASAHETVPAGNAERSLVQASASGNFVFDKNRLTDSILP